VREIIKSLSGIDKEVRNIRGKRDRGTQVNSEKNISSVILSLLELAKDREHS